MEKTAPIPDRYLRACLKWVDALNTGRMNVFKDVPYSDGNLTRFKRMLIMRDVKCRVSYQDKQSTTKDEPSQGMRSIRVVTLPDISIPAGSILEITYAGETHKYKQSGRPHVNDFRQSIPVEIYEEHV